MLKHCGKQNSQKLGITSFDCDVLTTVSGNIVSWKMFIIWQRSSQFSGICIYFRDREMALQSVYNMNSQNKKEYQLLYNTNL